MVKRAIAYGLIFALLTTSLAAPVAFAQDGREAYNSGFEAGKEDGPKDVSLLKILWGVIFGPFAVAYNLFTRPEVPDERIVRVSDEGDDYVSGYLDGYRRGYKEQSVMYNVIGWASWLLYVVINETVDFVDLNGVHEVEWGY